MARYGTHKYPGARPQLLDRARATALAGPIVDALWEELQREFARYNEASPIRREEAIRVVRMDLQTLDERGWRYEQPNPYRFGGRFGGPMRIVWAVRHRRVFLFERRTKTSWGDYDTAPPNTHVPHPPKPEAANA